MNSNSNNQSNNNGSRNGNLNETGPIIRTPGGQRGTFEINNGERRSTETIILTSSPVPNPPKPRE